MRGQQRDGYGRPVSPSLGVGQAMSQRYHIVFTHPEFKRRLKNRAAHVGELSVARGGEIAP